MAQAAVRQNSIQQDDGFGELPDLEKFTRAFMAASNGNDSDTAEKAKEAFKAAKDYVLSNSAAEEDGAVSSIFHEIVRISEKTKDYWV